MEDVSSNICPALGGGRYAGVRGLSTKLDALQRAARRGGHAGLESVLQCVAQKVRARPDPQERPMGSLVREHFSRSTNLSVNDPHYMSRVGGVLRTRTRPTLNLLLLLLLCPNEHSP